MLEAGKATSIATCLQCDELLVGAKDKFVQFLPCLISLLQGPTLAMNDMVTFSALVDRCPTLGENVAK
jgi:hypothetical protein